MTLRHFLYLDDTAVNQALAQLEGSVPGDNIDTESRRRKEGSGKVGVANFGVGVGGEVEGHEKTRRHLSAEARFDRLYRQLREDAEVQALDAFDPAIVGDLRRGEVLEIEAEVTLPELFHGLDAFNGIAGLLPGFEALGLLDEETEEQFSQIGVLAQMFGDKPVPVTFHAARTPGVAFGATLDRRWLRCDLSDLVGPTMVVGTVQRQVPDGETFTLWSPFGGDATLQALGLNRKPRRVAKKKQSNENNGSGTVDDVVVKLNGLGVVLRPIAIFE